MEIVFGDGEPGRDYDCTLVCPDCHEEVRFVGTHWTNDDDNVAILIESHKSSDCRAWPNVWWRAIHHHGPLQWWVNHQWRRRRDVWRRPPPS